MACHPNVNLNVIYLKISVHLGSHTALLPVQYLGKQNNFISQFAADFIIYLFTISYIISNPLLRKLKYMKFT